MVFRKGDLIFENSLCKVVYSDSLWTILKPGYHDAFEKLWEGTFLIQNKSNFNIFSDVHLKGIKVGNINFGNRESCGDRVLFAPAGKVRPIHGGDISTQPVTIYMMDFKLEFSVQEWNSAKCIETTVYIDILDKSIAPFGSERVKFMV